MGLEDQMQSTIQGAIAKARETVGNLQEAEDSDEAELVAERKFSSATAIVLEGESGAAAPILARKSLLQLVLPLLVVGVAAAALRRSMSRAGGALLQSEPLD